MVENRLGQRRSCEYDYRFTEYEYENEYGDGDGDEYGERDSQRRSVAGRMPLIWRRAADLD